MPTLHPTYGGTHKGTEFSDLTLHIYVLFFVIVNKHHLRSGFLTSPLHFSLLVKRPPPNGPRLFSLLIESTKAFRRFVFILPWRREGLQVQINMKPAMLAMLLAYFRCLMENLVDFPMLFVCVDHVASPTKSGRTTPLPNCL